MGEQLLNQQADLQGLPEADFVSDQDAFQSGCIQYVPDQAHLVRESVHFPCVKSPLRVF